MYANPQRQEYEALVGRVREHYGSSVEIGGYDNNSLLRLRQLDAKREAAVAAQKAAKPLNDAIAQLNREHQRAVKAWQQIGTGQKRIAIESKARKLNSAAAQWEQFTPDQQNRALILAIADRLGM